LSFNKGGRKRGRRCYNFFMQMNSFTRRVAAWAACLAILMSALAPSVSHALASARGMGIAWMEVCSVAGTRLVKADPGMEKANEPTQHDASGQAGHCPFCSTHDASFALPPPASALFNVDGSTRLRPPLFYQSPRPLPIWTNAQSRAPPVFS
jgi:hypothetical protein